MDITANAAVESTVARQNVALSGIRQSAERDQQFAEIIAETVQSSPVSGARGSNVNILV